ncbi:hypothetical protein L3X38_038315 [Prunus dulcis]|uniref:Uncharacterized protein n=1 Tax=Prunus dulcis TaxID=3755 RepID=A0AAD4YQC9_PRUDU|nr:hypothetical protein L3X38_038315 [Prunus dulcis]
MTVHRLHLITGTKLSFTRAPKTTQLNAQSSVHPPHSAFTKLPNTNSPTNQDFDFIETHTQKQTLTFHLNTKPKPCSSLPKHCSRGQRVCFSFW